MNLKITAGFVAIVGSILTSASNAPAQGLLKKFRDRIENNRKNEERLIDRVKKKIDEARKDAEKKAKELEDRMKNDRDDPQRRPTPADQNASSIADRNSPKTFGSRNDPDSGSRRQIVPNTRNPQIRGAQLVQNGRNVVVDKVQQQSIAEASGLRRSDIVIELAGFPVRRIRDINEVLAVVRPGDRIMMLVERSGEEKEILLEGKSDSASAKDAGMAPGPEDQSTVGSGTNDFVPDRGNAKSDKNSTRSVLGRAWQPANSDSERQKRESLQQEVQALRKTVERQNQMIIDLQKQLNSIKNRNTKNSTFGAKSTGNLPTPAPRLSGPKRQK